jgi:hypothetical protein
VYLLLAIGAGVGIHWWCQRAGWHPVVEMCIAGLAVLAIYVPGFARAWRLVGPHLPVLKRFAQQRPEARER